MKRPIIIALALLIICAVIPFALAGGTAVQASGGPVGVERTAAPTPVPLPIERKLFAGPELGDNLVAAGVWVNENDVCVVYGIDVDPGASHHVEVFYLQECVGAERMGE